jgi:hypothetical protein
MSPVYWVIKLTRRFGSRVTDFIRPDVMDDVGKLPAVGKVPVVQKSFYTDVGSV